MSEYLPPDESVDVTTLTEAELIEIICTLPTGVEPIATLAMDEYSKRRSEVIGRAMAERALERQRDEPTS